MPDGDSGDLAAAVREFRRRAGGITQAELASRLGVTERYVSAAEHGRQLGPGSLRKLVKLMDQAGQIDLAKCVRGMVLSERDFRSLEHKISTLAYKVSQLADRLDVLERRESATRRQAGRDVASCNEPEPKVPVYDGPSW